MAAINPKWQVYCVSHISGTSPVKLGYGAVSDPG
jgi:hypothetical protein